MLPRLKNAKLEKCSHCMAGNQIRVSFKKHPPSRKSELLELVHYDVCGPLKVKKLWVYTLKSKDQVLEKFKHFQALVERQLGKKVKCNRSNNGGEYCGPFDGEALYTIVHVINLSPTIALNTEVPDKIWFGKDVKYDHLRVFSCNAFVHVPKDERPKLDMKTRQCIFMGYSHDEYGYRMYVPVEKKLVISRDVQFMEDQIIEDINKVKKSTPEKDNSLSEIDPLQMPIHDLDTTDNNAQNVGDGFDVPLDDDAEEEQKMSQNENLGDALEPPPVQIKRSNRQRQSSTRYTPDEYVTLTDGEEPECYQETMESEERQKAWQSKLQKSKHIDVRYHWICDALDAKLLELAKVHTDDNGVDMMTKIIGRGRKSEFLQPKEREKSSTFISAQISTTSKSRYCSDLDLEVCGSNHGRPWSIESN
ncbi:hypothetical protein CR513_03448, partial [Mucuna pruriens]